MVGILVENSWWYYDSLVNKRSYISQHPLMHAFEPWCYSFSGPKCSFKENELTVRFISFI